MGMIFADAIPIQGLIGGLLIGAAAAIMLLGLGRIAGVSGLAARAAGISTEGAPWPIAVAFVVGLPAGATLVAALIHPVAAHFTTGAIGLIGAGLLVGFGTRMGSGCTSGHGVCGLSRFSRRSLVATVIFMIGGFGTVALVNAMGWTS